MTDKHNAEWYRAESAKYAQKTSRIIVRNGQILDQNRFAAVQPLIQQSQQILDARRSAWPKPAPVKPHGCCERCGKEYQKGTEIQWFSKPRESDGTSAIMLTICAPCTDVLSGKTTVLSTGVRSITSRRKKAGARPGGSIEGKSSKLEQPPLETARIR